MTRTSHRRTRDFWLGARLAIGDGRKSIVRLSLTAIGIALVTFVLLSISAAATAIGDQLNREDARQLVPATGTTSSLRVLGFDRDFDKHQVKGMRLEQTGPNPPLPPGLRSIPKPGEIVLSPRLAELLASRDGELLRPYFPERVVGKVGSAGLTGPNELYFYVGEKLDSTAAMAVSDFGFPRDSTGLDVRLLLFIAPAVAAGLAPLVLFVITSSRVGGVSRDRRLAAIRLVGADTAQLRRVAAGESLVGAAVGLVAGIGIFFATRPAIELFDVDGVSFYASAWTPSAISVLLIVAAVPLVAVGSALFALRRTVVEPLGVVRRVRSVKRKLIWRLALLTGGGVIVALGTQLKDGNSAGLVTGAGAILVFLSVPTLLPWVLERIAGAVRSKRPAVLLAVRRLQLDSSTPARVTAGVSMVLAGAVALQILLGTALANLREEPTGTPDVTVNAPGTSASAEQLQAALRGVPGLTPRTAITDVPVSTTTGANVPLVVAPCQTLRSMARLASCHDGDVFLSNDGLYPLRVGPGSELGLNPDPMNPGKAPEPGGPRWVIPSSASGVTAASGGGHEAFSAVLATPGVVPAELVARGHVTVDFRADNLRPETMNRVSSAVAGFGRDAAFHTNESMTDDESVVLLRRIVFIVTCVAMFIAMASLLVSTIDSLVERRQPIAVMSAAGVPRRTLAGSLIFQSMVPLLLSAVIALGIGAGLAVLTMLGAGVPTSDITVDWAELGSLIGVVVLVAVLVAASTLPTLRRAMRPEGLRVE